MIVLEAAISQISIVTNCESRSSARAIQLRTLAERVDLRAVGTDTFCTDGEEVEIEPDLGGRRDRAERQTSPK